jgi:phenylacetate-coenzyme A ligase PaaK-like adenylate-forming protein
MLRLYMMDRKLRGRERWKRERLLRYQQEALQRLREFAYAKSPFYRWFHDGLFDSPIQELPILTKTKLMENWNEVVTDRNLTLDQVKNYLAQDDWSTLLRGKYYVNMTSGTTGLRGIFVYDTSEWLSTLAGASRNRGWAGAPARLTKAFKQAWVTTVHPWHQTALMGATTQSRISPSLRVDSTEPMNDLVSKLNAFQPEVLFTYPSMAKQLAHSQLAGELKIAPKVVTTGAEPLTGDVREAVVRAWGVMTFDSYGGTECAAWAGECSEHRGLHVHEDRVVAEFVDQHNNPVAPGQYGAKVLITVLSTRTLPLIRYELNDSVQPSKDICPCGRPFALLNGVQGRLEEVIHMTGQSVENVAVQPLFFQVVMEKLEADGWQVFQVTKSNLRVSILHPAAGFDEVRFKGSLIRGLTEQGVASPSIEVDFPTALKTNPIGKVFLIKALVTQSAEDSSRRDSQASSLT